MDVKPFGPKARKAVKSKGFLTAYEGSVRSMKTVTSLVELLLYVVKSPENVFLMSGNTLGSVSRNCIQGDFGLIAITGGKAKTRTDADGSKFIQLGKKKIYYCGADDAASYKKIRGLSIGGWYADEINLHNREFIENALARSFASQDRKNIWTLNPDAPNHWIYTDYLDKYRDQQTPGYNYFHFNMDDNPGLTPERKAEIASQFSGVFYKRYVLGLRVRAEGAIYVGFGDKNKLDKYPENIHRVTIGVDFGGNGSATVFSATGWFIKDKKMCLVTLMEKYISHKSEFNNDNDSVEKLFDEWKIFYRKVSSQWPVDSAYADSAEQLLRKSMNGLGMPIEVENSMKRPIIDRIRTADVLYTTSRKFIMRSCPKLIEAVENAVWDQKAVGAVRLDDGTSNVDSLDADEYSWEREAADLVERV